MPQKLKKKKGNHLDSNSIKNVNRVTYNDVNNYRTQENFM